MKKVYTTHYMCFTLAFDCNITSDLLFYLSFYFALKKGVKVQYISAALLDFP